MKGERVKEKPHGLTVQILKAKVTKITQLQTSGLAII